MLRGEKERPTVLLSYPKGGGSTCFCFSARPPLPDPADTGELCPHGPRGLHDLPWIPMDFLKSVSSSSHSQDVAASRRAYDGQRGGLFPKQTRRDRSKK